MSSTQRETQLLLPWCGLAFLAGSTLLLLASVIHPQITHSPRVEHWLFGSIILGFLLIWAGIIQGLLRQRKQSRGEASRLAYFKSLTLANMSHDPSLTETQRQIIEQHVAEPQQSSPGF